MQIDFSAAFDRVNYQGILYKLCPVGIGGLVLSTLIQFLSNRSEHIVVGTQKCIGSIIVPPVHFGVFSVLENKLIGYADDTTLLSVVPSPVVRVTVAESLNCDIGKVSELV